MNLNKIISIFGNNSINSIRKEDLLDPNKKNEAAVKSLKNIFDTNLDGQIDDKELSLIDKLSNLQGNNNEISISELKFLASMNGSPDNLSFGDLSILKNSKYSTEGNSVSSFDLNNRKTSTTTFKDDGTVVKTTYGYDKSETKSEYTSDYKLQTKTVTKNTGVQEISKYNDSGVLIQKDEIAVDGSKTTTLYNADGKTSLITKTDSNNGFVSKEEYDYDDNGSIASITEYDTNEKEIAKTLWTDDKTKVQVKYDSNGEIIQRDTFNRSSKPLSSFIKNDDGSSLSTEYTYKTNRDVIITAKTTNPDGSLKTEETTTKFLNGNMTVYTNGVLTQNDEINTDGTIKSTVYSAENVIDTVTVKDKKGNIQKIDQYSYLDGKIDTITQKDSKGNLLASGKYHYDDPSCIKYLDHFDAENNLLDKSVWNLDGTSTVFKYNNGAVNITENYGTNGLITDYTEKAENGETTTGAYTYNTPNDGDISLNSINKDSNGNITSIFSSIAYKNGSGESTVYNGDKTQILEKSSIDRYGNKTVTAYENNQIKTVTTTNSSGFVKVNNNYNYTNGILTSIDHLNASKKSIGITKYDADGNSKEYDSLGKLISSITTDKTTGVVTTESYQYMSSGHKVIKITEMLNGKAQSLITKVVHIDNSTDISIYDGTNLRLSQKDFVSPDGTVKSTIYNQEKNRISRVITRNAAGNLLLRNEYSYASNRTTIDNIKCYDNNDALIQHLQYTSDGGKIITNYDADGNVKNVTTYDKEGNPISIQ